MAKRLFFQLKFFREPTERGLDPNAVPPDCETTHSILGMSFKGTHHMNFAQLTKPLLALLLAGSTAHAAPVFNIDMPLPTQHFSTAVDMEGLQVGDTVFELNVTVPVGGAFLKVFQVFGGDIFDTNYGEYRANFALEVNQSPNTWTMIDYDYYWYHNYLDVFLEGGERTFKVTLTGSEDGVFPVAAGRYADVRFGDTIPAVPLPAGAVLLVSSLAALPLARRRRKPTSD